eukprot:CAMPEP_0176171904 /NCGR_PEP_ID=MMETSP0120_2-20121206/88041_1 /TAXON_ID=160619 /ORGANISM="Kryptoperidinium foliaceum, Strain CCMP 1326" /LENGTH=51 /DNA_ID=CAMNT_0017509815 /DNA_START=20 /DNA_END=172 /DNA_ORIENTATION=-
MTHATSPKRNGAASAERRSNPSTPKRSGGNGGLISRIAGTIGRSQTEHQSK